MLEELWQLVNDKEKRQMDLVSQRKFASCS